MESLTIIAYALGVIGIFIFVLWKSTKDCAKSIVEKNCMECDRHDEEGKIIKSGVGIEYWVCEKHFPENIKRFWEKWIK